ncbi:hypothetical protein EJB05_16580 [Eragrostis curvula]|uniref:Fe2OG dioxygenase domain-containing protein n=1 Tax=Eragrostis curvula TaxID=38414 RepID=A0A5J9VEI4_9POAL|nr:hypothetical protein EJB05_16580 [Eragrostis curvula]
MELFLDGHHVRLRSRVHGKYLHADEDGLGVSLRSLRESPNAVWQVHRVERDGGTCVLLHGAAYGSYLAATGYAAPPGHLGQCVVQGVYDDPGDDAIVWRAVRTGGEGNYVFLRHISYRLLRANGRYQVWHNGVSVDHYDNESSMMHWSVESVPPHPVLPQLPAPTHDVLLPSGGFMGLFRRRIESMPAERAIRYVRADANGIFNDQAWETFEFHGRSVFTLRQELATLVGETVFFFNILVCAKAGRYARLTPLFTDLPRSAQPMDIVVLTAGSPAVDQLRYPNIVSENSATWQLGWTHSPDRKKLNSTSDLCHLAANCGRKSVSLPLTNSPKSSAAAPMETAAPPRVQALADAGVPHLPAQYVQPPEHRPAPSSSSHRAAALSVPVVDLSSASAAGAVRAACADWGAFHVVGHGVPVELLDAMREAGLAFFCSPMEDKLRFACDPTRGAATEGYGSRMLANDDSVLDWRDYFDHHTLPESRRNPPTGRISSLVTGEPDLALGLQSHSDMGAITLLIQDDVGGLEIITNGIYKSSVHRAIVNAERARLSVATFYDPSKARKICTAARYS